MTSVEKNWMFIFGKNRLQCLNLLVLVAWVLVLISFHASRGSDNWPAVHCIAMEWTWAIYMLFLQKGSGLELLCFYSFRDCSNSAWKMSFDMSMKHVDAFSGFWWCIFRTRHPFAPAANWTLASSNSREWEQSMVEAQNQQSSMRPAPNLGPLKSAITVCGIYQTLFL